MDIQQAKHKFDQLVALIDSTLAVRDKAAATASSFMHMMHFESASDFTAAEDFEDIIERQRRGLGSFLKAALASEAFNHADVFALISMLEPSSKYLGLDHPEVENLAMRMGVLFDPKNQ